MSRKEGSFSSINIANLLQWAQYKRNYFAKDLQRRALTSLRRIYSMLWSHMRSSCGACAGQGSVPRPAEYSNILDHSSTAKRPTRSFNQQSCKNEVFILHSSSAKRSTRSFNQQSCKNEVFILHSSSRHHYSHALFVSAALVYSLSTTIPLSLTLSSPHLRIPPPISGPLSARPEVPPFPVHRPSTPSIYPHNHPSPLHVQISELMR